MLVTIQDFGGWDAAQATYFADGGMFDRVFTPGTMILAVTSLRAAGLRPDTSASRCSGCR